MPIKVQAVNIRPYKPDSMQPYDRRSPCDSPNELAQDSIRCQPGSL